MFACTAISAFGILLALFLAVFKLKPCQRLISAIIAAALTVGMGALAVDSVFFREIRDTEIRLDDLVNNAGVKSRFPINIIYGSDGEKYWCFGKIDGGYYLEKNAEPVRIEYCTNTRIVLRIARKAEYRVPILSSEGGSAYVEIYSLGSAFVIFALLVGFAVLATFVTENLKKGIDI